MATRRGIKAPSTPVVTAARPAASRAAAKPKPKAPAKPKRQRGPTGGKPEPGVAAAVKRDLEKLPAELAVSALAATALAMARELDYAENSATAKSACARALAEALRELRALAPPEETKDGIDQLAARRAKRRARVANPKALPRT